MRITGGKYKGKQINTISGQGIRPTSSKVRESIFNIIKLTESGTVFYDGETAMLDLFAGSGIMGLEALSRGAKSVVFVEKNPRHAEIIKKNMQSFSELHAKIVVADALKALDKLDKQFTFIFIDPPYASGLYEPVLKKIQQNKLLSDNGFIVLEHSSSFEPEENGFKLYKTKTYGDTEITILLPQLSEA